MYYSKLKFGIKYLDIPTYLGYSLKSSTTKQRKNVFCPHGPCLVAINEYRVNCCTVYLPFGMKTYIQSFCVAALVEKYQVTFWYVDLTRSIKLLESKAVDMLIRLYCIDDP